MKGQICSITRNTTYLILSFILTIRLDASEVSKKIRYRCILLRQHELSVWKKIAWQQNKDLQHSHGSCNQQLLPIVSWIFQSPDYLVNTSCPQHHHPGILSISSLSTDSPYPVMGCLQLTFTKTQEKSKHQFGVTSSPLPGYLLARLNFVEIQDSLPKHENLVFVPEEREQPPTAYIFQSNAGLEVLHIKKPPSLSVPASAKDLTPFFQPGPLIRRNPTQQCLPLGEERVVFLGSPFQSPRNWFLPQIGVGNPEFQKYIDWLTEVNWFSSCEHI